LVAGDISETEVCNAMVKAAVDNYGGLDCALNNAGVMDAIFPGDPIDYERQKPLAMARIDEATDAYWDVVMRVNATGTFRSMRAELKQLLRQARGGSIVNVASVAGLRGFGGTPSYVASKHAVNGLTKNAAIDYAPFGIRVNSVCMGTTVTPMYERAFTLLSQRAAGGVRETGIGMLKIDSLLQWSNQKKTGSMPAEQVAVMLFLLSPESSNLTGANFATDGGFTTY
jgi:NAD(P)-dependent dehydrogenase (short-subunit alcohol dehydrogenase family)